MKSRLLVLSLLATLFALSAVASACGGGGDDELKQALESLSENDLAIMVLPQDDLGDEFADLEVEADSGFVDNEVAADDSVDPDDTTEDLDEAGRLNGYDLTYSDPDLSALEAGQGILSVSTEIDLFKDAGSASDMFAKQIEDHLRLEGEEIKTGTTLEDVERFAVNGLADEAVGLRQRASFNDAQVYGTVVAFRLDRLVGAASLARADDADDNSQVAQIAQSLEQRIESVLLGEITGTPEAIPETEEEAEAEATVPAPEGIPDLAAMALNLDDLPAGVSVDSEGYVEDEGTVASYERAFDLGDTSIGSSPFLSLENDVDLFETSSEAAAFLTSFEALYTSEAGAELFAAGFAGSAGFEATNVRAESVPVPDLGGDSFAVVVSFDTPLGSYEAVNIIARVSRVIGLLILVGPAGEGDVSDVVPLVEAMAERMAAEIGATP